MDFTETRSHIVLTIASRHPQAPSFHLTADDYVGYFQNRHGEQAIFVYGEAGGRLYHGDIEWTETLVAGGEPVGLLLDPDEQAWLRACWAAAVFMKGSAGQGA